jgi:hypothetical protein
MEPMETTQASLAAFLGQSIYSRLPVTTTPIMQSVYVLILRREMKLGVRSKQQQCWPIARQNYNCGLFL